MMVHEVLIDAFGREMVKDYITKPTTPVYLVKETYLHLTIKGL